MGDRAPYSRVYWSVMEDPKFDGIREDPRHLGSWTLLLIVADMAWPAPAFPPPAIPKASMKALVDAGLIDPLSGGRFRLHGLDAERSWRQNAARSGTKRDPSGNHSGPERTPELPLAEQSRDETEKSQAEQGDPLDTYWVLSGTFPSGNAKKWLEEMSNEFGPEATSNALASEWSHGSRNDFLKRAQNRLRSNVVKAARAVEVKVTEKEQARRAAMDITPEEAERRAAEAKRLMGEWTAAMPPVVGPFQPIGSKS